MQNGKKVADIDEISTNGSIVVSAEKEGGEEEVVIVRINDAVYAFENHCIHWTDVKLDKGDGAEIRNEEIVCQKHGAIFDVENGFCSYGPCKGGSLKQIEVRVENGSVYLSDPDYKFISKIKNRSRDLSSRGGMDF